MYRDVFSTILDELGKILQIPGLEPDKNNTCLIKFPSGLKIWIEPHKGGNDLILACDFGIIPPGKFRENVFQEALKSNGQMPPKVGDFAYSKQADHLMLYQMIPLKELNGEKLFSLMKPFMEKALIWQETLQQGNVPSGIQGYASTRKGGSGMFGLS